MKKNNILLFILDFLDVKYTKTYARKYYEEHPHKNDLLGVSNMLCHYGIKSEGLKLEKEIASLQELEAPFIAHVDGTFAVVIEIKQDKITYFVDGQKNEETYNRFLKKWSGVVLLFEKQNMSIEPDYERHKKKEMILSFIKLGFFFSLFYVFLFFCVNTCKGGVELLSTIPLNLLGIYVSYLLVLKQLDVKDKLADKICVAFSSKNGCNAALESSASKWFGILSLSEIGLGYFVTNILIILYFPNLYAYLALVNLMALPFSLWCVGYQAVILKQWCPLCMFVQIFLWGIFVSNLFLGLISFDIGFLRGLFVLSLYVIFICSVHIIATCYENICVMIDLKYKLNLIKSNKEIFRSLIDHKRKYDIDRSFGLFIGNRESKNVVTIVTNPHCSPCADLHTKIDEYVQNGFNNMAFQLILFSFNEDLEKSSKLFLHNYLTLPESDFMEFLREWYRYGRNNRVHFYSRYLFDENEEMLNLELDKHKVWTRSNGIYMTPFLLFNGYIFPEEYSIGDLSLFENVQLDM